MAAKLKLVSGYGDGNFYPKKAIKVGEAVAILMRVVGFTDEKEFPVWPYSYMAKAEEIGMLTGTGLKATDGNNQIDRATAARLFTSALTCNGKFYEVSDQLALKGVDTESKTLVTTSGTIPMSHAGVEAQIVGTVGRVISLNGKALTFVPEVVASDRTNGLAVVVANDKSTAGFDALTAKTDYKLIKNGIKIAASDLRKNDVATYSETDNTIYVCDARISTYYEACSPNPQTPVTITCMGGQNYKVLKTAQASLSKYKPGEMVTLLLTIDGKIAGAADSVGNAYGYVTAGGSMMMLCGGETVNVGYCSDGDALGQGAQFSSYKKTGESSATVKAAALYSRGLGDFDVKAGKIGRLTLAENAIIVNNGMEVTKFSLGSIVPADKISYVHSNWKGQIDLVVVHGADASGVVYGKIKSYPTTIYDEETGDPIGSGWEVSLYHKDGVIGPFTTSFNYRNGDFYYANDNGTGSFGKVGKLTKVANVSKDTWTGISSVTVSGKTYTLDSSITCYIPSSDSWISFDEALLYAKTFNLYVDGSAVRVLEVAE